MTSLRRDAFGAQTAGMNPENWQQFYENHPYKQMIGAANGPGSSQRGLQYGPPGGQSGGFESPGPRRPPSGPPRPSAQPTASANPLENKVMVVYYNPNPADQLSAQARETAKEFSEILLQDASQVYPRPPWMSDSVTAVSVKTKRIFQGRQALFLIHQYATFQRRQGGAQGQAVLEPSVGYNAVGWEDFDSEHSSGTAAAVPVGTTGTKANVAQVPKSTVEDPRYYSNGSVNESDMNAYMSQRQKVRQRTPAKLEPSVLGNGEYVTM